MKNRWRVLENKIFVRWLSFASILTMVLLLIFFITLLLSSWPAIKANGFGFLWHKTWDPVADHYGMLPFLVGTLLTSFLALIISAPFSVAAALFLGEYYPKGLIPNIFRNVIDLLAAIPSVVYGFWGLFTVAPLIAKLEVHLHIKSPSGLGILTASIVLAIMLIPYSVALIRQVISMTPVALKEAAYALGSTRAEVITKVIIPTNISGISAGFLLSLGRALGETMAVTILIGNSPELPHNIFSPSHTMASVIANEFSEAGGIYGSTLIEVGLLLFVVTTIINFIGRIIIKRVSY